MKLWEANGENPTKPKAGSLRILIKLRYVYTSWGKKEGKKKLLVSGTKREKIKL